MVDPVTVEQHDAGAEAPAVAAAQAEHASVAEAHQAGTEVAHGGAEAHAVPSALGLDATQWVAIAMLVVIAIMVWKKVPAMIGASLDAKIAGIREHLDAAAKLRKEAEALKAEYEARVVQATKDADAIRAQALHDADALTAQAKVDAEALIARRTRMAEDKIAAAERAAIAEVRAKAADVAVQTAARLIAKNHGSAVDQALIDQTISGIGAKSLNS